LARDKHATNDYFSTCVRVVYLDSLQQIERLRSSFFKVSFICLSICFWAALTTSGISVDRINVFSSLKDFSAEKFRVQDLLVKSDHILVASELPSQA
jgi:hypothetical protein